MITARIHGGWIHADKYLELLKWAEKHNAYLDPKGGTSWINGKTYLHTMQFQFIEDKLACKIIFGNLIV